MPDDDVVNTAPCPLCGAPKGRPCMVADEYEASVPHVARVIAAAPPASILFRYRVEWPAAPEADGR